MMGLLCLNTCLFAQQDAWVYLKDKPHVTTSISNPITILTQKAIDRKNSHGIVIDARDVPVNESYLAQLKSASGITVMAKSKWFNAVHVRGSETDLRNLALNTPFIDTIDFANKSLQTNKQINKTRQNVPLKLEQVRTAFNYGSALNQIQMFNGDQLHSANYTGAGMTVAVLDAGFPNVNTMNAFRILRDTGHLLGAYDFVNRDPNVFNNTTSNHGTLVLSTMAGFVENQYVGTAPDAFYYLFITEDTLHENPVEESYWVEAVERADSLGVDIINTSLGYTTFDNPDYNYTTASMNGETTFITKGANIAFEKGLLLVNSAGNSGSGSWQIVSAPADSPGVLTVGAVTANGNYASFSSKGSSIQPTLKPDVVAQGQATYVVDQNDFIGTSNGTSFSSPVLAGGMACLWQALPHKTNAEIMQLVRQSASQYSNPNYFLGYGIPNLETALNIELLTAADYQIDKPLSLAPNPTKGILKINLPNDIEKGTLHIFNILGNEVGVFKMSHHHNELNISSFYAGVYVAKFVHENGVHSFKISKE